MHYAICPEASTMQILANSSGIDATLNAYSILGTVVNDGDLFNVFWFPQGLLRELCKAQGHSSPGVTEWDWSKFEAQPGLGGVGDIAGEVVVKAGETSQVPGPWQALPVDSKPTTKTNVRPMMDIPRLRD